MSKDIALPAAPAALHAGGGRPIPFGSYRGPIAELSTSAWDGDGGITSRRRTQRKAWQYFGAFSEQFMVGFAAVDAGVIANGFCYVYDRERDLLVEEAATVPFGFASNFVPRLTGEWRLKSGSREWSITHRDDHWQVNFSGKRLRVSLDVTGPGQGLSAVASSIGRPFAHTYKVCALPAQIDVEVDGIAGSSRGGGSLDFTLGYPPRHTLWNWASAYGQTSDGRQFGLNLVGQFMNGQENGLWLEDELIGLPQAAFDYDPNEPLSPWRVRTLDGTVDLEFVPEGRRSQKLRAGVMASVFSQPFGRFTGVVRHGGHELDVTALGVVEEHIAVW